AAAGRIGVAEALAVLGHCDDPAGAIDAAGLGGGVVGTRGRVAGAPPPVGAPPGGALPAGRRGPPCPGPGRASPHPGAGAHLAALAAGAGPDGAVADALDVAAAAAHARAGHAAAGQFAAQAVAFTPALQAAALVRRRIRAGELLYLAGEVEQSRAQLQELD